MGVPGLRRLTPSSLNVVGELSGDHACIDTYDPITQRLDSHHFYREANGRFRYGFTPQRYAWPSELDLMARIAGLRLVERWGRWERGAFTAESRQHISVWQKPKDD